MKKKKTKTRKNARNNRALKRSRREKKVASLKFKRRQEFDKEKEQQIRKQEAEIQKLLASKKI